MGLPMNCETPTSSYQTVLSELQAWSPGPLAALIYVDIRCLKDINRFAGVEEGDRIIRAVEDILKQWSAGRAIVGRIWSNEFLAAKAIDHTQTAGDEASDLRERLRCLSFKSEVGNSPVSVSIGLTVHQESATWVESVGEASKACAIAKQRGPNQVVRFGSKLTNTPTFSATAVSEFRKLLHSNQLCLHAQPIMDISGPEPVAAKAEFLIRMDTGDDQPRPLAPGVIQTLEHFGLSTELDRFTSSFFLEWIDSRRRVLDRVHSLSINLSAASIGDGRFIDDLYREIRNSRLPAGKICLEITETAAISHLDVAAEIITAFKSIGCRFSLDDFGSGLCSFAHLNSLPVDEVKVDGCFIRDIANSEVSREIVKAVHHVATVTGKKTVAEFVDEPEKFQLLQKIGVNYAQGWLFHPAIDPDDFVELLPQA